MSAKTWQIKIAEACDLAHSAVTWGRSSLKIASTEAVFLFLVGSTFKMARTRSSVDKLTHAKKLKRLYLRFTSARFQL